MADQSFVKLNRSTTKIGNPPRQSRPDAGIDESGGKAIASSRKCAIAFLGVLLGGCGTLTGSNGPPPVLIARTTAADQGQAAEMISRYRMAHGLNAVRFDPILERAADMQARAVAETGELSHGDFTGRMELFGSPARAAENLGAGIKTVPEAMDMWQHSAGHDANLLFPGVERIGIAHIETPGAGYKHYWALELAQ